jgi:hypothetical protein
VKNFCQISIDTNMERVVKSVTNEPGGPMSGLQDSEKQRLLKTGNSMIVNKNTIITSLACVAVLTLAAPTTSHANVLVNSGFELDTPPALSAWTVLASGGTVETTSAYAHSGNNSLLIDATGAGQWASPNVYQSFAASPGEEWNLSGYMMTLQTLPNWNPNPQSFGLFKIVFQNALNQDLVPASASIGNINLAFPGIESTPFLDNNSPLGTWIFSEAQGVAPANTTHVLLFALNVNGSANTMYFDDISASIIPEPSTLALAGLGLASLVGFRRRK